MPFICIRRGLALLPAVLASSAYVTRL